MESATTIKLKICGITQVEQARTIASYGVDAIGVIGVESSSRFVNEKQRREIFRALKLFYPEVQRVWVTADLKENDLTSALNGEGIPSVVQLHGNESQKNCKILRATHSSTQWWKAIRVRSLEDLKLAKSYENSVNAILLDAWDPTQLGGTGKRLPLEWIQEADFSLPWWLAGGISIEWVEKILKKTKPYGLDASSRLEKSPGIKDLKLVKELIKELKTNQTNK